MSKDQATKKEFELIQFEPNQIVNFSEWENRQKQLVKDNPFIHVHDKETHEIGRKRRTNLVTGRTDLQKERDAVKKELNRAKTFVADKYDGFIAISVPAETEQQRELTEYESELQAEKDREAEIAQERADGIRNLLSDKESELEDVIQKMTAHNIEGSKKEFNEMVLNGADEDFAEFTFMWTEATARQKANFESRVTELEKAEKTRLEQLSIQRQSKINELYRQANTIIDDENHPYMNLITDVKNIFDIKGFEFGEHFNSFQKTKIEMIAKAETKAKAVQKQAKEKAVQDHQKKVMEQADRVNQIGEGLMDQVFQLNVDSTDKEIDAIRSKYEHPDNILDEVIPAWDKMTNRVISTLTDKLEMIQMKREQQQQERIRLEGIKNARWDSRKPRLIKMGFVHDVNEKRFRHPEYSIELSVETVLTNGDESWKLLMDDAVQQIKSIKDSSAKEKARQEKIKMDKSELMEWINHSVRKPQKPFDFQNPEMDVFFGSIVDELNQWCDAKIDQIKKY